MLFGGCCFVLFFVFIILDSPHQRRASDSYRSFCLSCSPNCKWAEACVRDIGSPSHLLQSLMRKVVTSYSFSNSLPRPDLDGYLLPLIGQGNGPPCKRLLENAAPTVVMTTFLQVTLGKHFLTSRWGSAGLDLFSRVWITLPVLKAATMILGVLLAIHMKRIHWWGLGAWHRLSPAESKCVW